ncbi:hypothetical protein EMIHUDRAFT_431799 [Emiliania huxleyi CCMP1516]|uniref:Uncharacterized protein n=2 Tax=Emiliania huxleyi TaxID=2903 RepID=A0A0D3L180_EMIH1|nr:hypothetical protein EMIHUDRAFT_431799 [Emiliania huxleyi CCMP1516]EOD41765.1 hypothetical protein EMIHUDRAFT_431799 [Emiliania huxleyi CCMP1516]|eukprot:XP_005794194.1 hypothetical protein EMIHUDRAFT_431799 [Emiliania huxleyi CCMP1516]
MDPDWTPPRGGQRYGEERGGSGAPCVTTRRSAAAGSSSQAAWQPSPGADLSSHHDDDLFSDTDGSDENTDEEEEETPPAARRTPHAAAVRRRPQAAGKRKAKAAPACEQEDHRARARELAERRRKRHEALLPPQKELRTAEARRLRAESERLPQPAPDDAEACGTFMDSVLGNYVCSLRVEGEARGATARAGFTRTETLVAGMPVPPRCRFVAGWDAINAAAQAAAARQKEAAAAELARPPVAEAEGLRLRLSGSNSTRYRGVRGRWTAGQTSAPSTRRWRRRWRTRGRSARRGRPRRRRRGCGCTSPATTSPATEACTRTLAASGHSAWRTEGRYISAPSTRRWRRRWRTRGRPERPQRRREGGAHNAAVAYAALAEEVKDLKDNEVAAKERILARASVSSS